MSDLHVESLRYRLAVDEQYGRFENPPPLDHDTAAYRMRLEDGLLTVYMKEHHATVESASRQLEEDLRAWELDAALSRNHTWLRFDYEGAGIVDRDAPPGSVCVGVGAVGASAGVGTAIGIGQALMREYPSPPTRLKASPEVEGVFRRFERAVWIDNTQMLAIGYLCLSWLEGSTGLKGPEGARDKTVEMYRIERRILKMLGDLTSERGGVGEARKLDAGAKREPLTPAENAWLRAAIKTLIRRKAEYDYDPAAAASLPLITMQDLPCDAAM